MQRVREIRLDCDGDAILISIDQAGVACHEGYRSCFFRRLDGTDWIVDRDRGSTQPRFTDVSRVDRPWRPRVSSCQGAFHCYIGWLTGG